MAHVAAVEDEIARAGLCDTRAACASAEVKFEAGGWKIGPLQGGGVTINVYGVGDVALAQRILARCRAVHTTNAAAPVTITIFSNSHAQRIDSGSMNVVVKETIT
jgi:hypothetical protein